MSVVAINMSRHENYSEVLISGNKAEITNFAAYFAKGSSIQFTLKPKKLSPYPDLMHQMEIKLVQDSQGLVFTEREGIRFIFSGDSEALKKLGLFFESALVLDPGEHYHFDSDFNHDLLSPSNFFFVIEIEP